MFTSIIVALPFLTVYFALSATLVKYINFTNLSAHDSQIKQQMNITYLETQLLSILSNTDKISRIIIIILGFYSIATWVIIFDKLFKFRLLSAKMNRFSKNFWSGVPIYDIYQKYKDDTDCQSAYVFVTVMNEWDTLKNLDIDEQSVVVDRLYDIITVAENRSMLKIKSGMTFIHVVATTATLLGLLGTVWGISQSFRTIALMKEATLVALAPGVNSALVTTMIGLVAAIPALTAHHILQARINNIELELSNFSLELLGILTKELANSD